MSESEKLVKTIPYSFRLPPGDLILCLNYGEEVMKFCANGDIFHKGRKIENDQELVDGFRDWVVAVRAQDLVGVKDDTIAKLREEISRLKDPEMMQANLKELGFHISRRP